MKAKVLAVTEEIKRTVLCSY